MLRTPILPGAFLSSYSTIEEQVRHSHDGSGLLASVSSLMPMVFYGSTAPEVPTARLVSIDGNPSYDIDGTMFTRLTIDDLQCWYLWGSSNTIGFAAAPGRYYIRFSTKREVFYTETMNLCNICTGLKPRLRTNGFVAGVTPQFNIIAEDEGTDTILSQSTGELVDGNLINAVTAPSVTISSATSPVTIKRTVETPCGIMSATYNLSFNIADLANSIELDLVEQDFSPIEDSKGIWYLEVGNETDSNNIPYQFGWQQRYYFKPTFPAPEPEDSPEYLANGEGKQFFQQSILVGKGLVQFTEVIDPLKMALLFSRHHTTKRLVNTVTGYTIDLDYFDIGFTGSPDGVFSTALLTVDQSTLIQRACMDNMILRAPV